MLQDLAGHDCTDAFTQYHPSEVWARLERFHVANVIDEDCRPSPFVLGHRFVRQQLLREGLFETRPSFYVATLSWVALLFVASITLALIGTNWTAYMASAVLLGFFWQQLAFVGHDLGHNAVTHNMRRDTLTGSVLGSMLGGISIAWWKRSHNVHHVVTNSIEHDPDIQHLPLFAIDPQLVLNGGFYSSYHARLFRLDRVALFFLRHQHYLYYPIMAVARFNLYAQSWLLLLNSKARVPNRRIEIASLLLFAVWNAALLSVLPSAGAVLAYLLVSHAVAGILHVQITLSHFSMPAYEGLVLETRALTGRPYEWLAVQMSTSLDISSSWATRWFHGGLQFQIEHHIFPRLPRHSLPRARELLIEFCDHFGMKRNEVSFFEANIRTIECLRNTAAEVTAMCARAA